jgi:hypothetical protein
MSGGATTDMVGGHFPAPLQRGARRRENRRARACRRRQAISRRGEPPAQRAVPLGRPASRPVRPARRDPTRRDIRRRQRDLLRGDSRISTRSRDVCPRPPRPANKPRVTLMRSPGWSRHGSVTSPPRSPPSPPQRPTRWKSSSRAPRPRHACGRRATSICTTPSMCCRPPRC